MLSKFKSYVIDQSFHPGLLGIFINPFYIERRELLRTIRKYSNYATGNLLDVGCGHRPYEREFKKVESYTGLEYDTPKNRSRFKNVDAWYTGNSFPFESDKFDSVLMTEVIEHVFNPDDFLNEIRRVLKSGGRIIISAPFAWDEHEQPHDYARYSSFGLKHLLTSHGFEIESHTKTAADLRIIFLLLICYIHKRLAWIRPYYPRLLFYIVLISPLTIIGTILSWLLPKNPDLYMDNVFVARKL